MQTKEKKKQWMENKDRKNLRKRKIKKMFEKRNWQRTELKGQMIENI